MGFFDKIENVSGSNIIKKVLYWRSIKCLLRELVNAGHSSRICLTVSGQWQAEHSGWSVQRCSTESGHSFIQWLRLRDIEKRLKYHSEIYVPKCWYIIAEAWSGSKPLTVYQMKQEDFLSTTALETAIVNWKTTVDGQKVIWFEMRQIEVRCTDPMSLYYKTSHIPDEPWKQIDLTRRGHSTMLSGITQKRLYEGPRVINPSVSICMCNEQTAY